MCLDLHTEVSEEVGSVIPTAPFRGSLFSRGSLACVEHCFQAVLWRSVVPTAPFHGSLFFFFSFHRLKHLWPVSRSTGNRQAVAPGIIQKQIEWRRIKLISILHKGGAHNSHPLYVSRFGLAVRFRLVSRRASAQLRFGSPSSLKRIQVVCGHCLVTLPLTINETLKWLSSLPILTQESFWW